MRKIYFFIFSLFISVLAIGQTNHLVISQVYGGGGNTGATYRNDFIEIFNPSSSAISLNGLSVQYAGSGSTNWVKADLPNLTLQPGQYYLIQGASGGAIGATLPTPDLTTTIDLAAGSGKVILINSTTEQDGTDCPSDVTIIDKVGYGSSNTCFEGTGPTPTLDNAEAAIRGGNGCTDTDNNITDLDDLTPTPRNTSSPLNICQPDPNAGDLVINEIYAGGGNSGATYTHDFIEIFNSSNTNTVSLRNLSIQYAGATGTAWDRIDLPNVSLQPRQYFLIQGASGGAAGVALPTPDLNASSISMAVSGGKVVLIARTSDLDGTTRPTGPTVIDLIGYGPTANCFETAAAPAMTNTTSLSRPIPGVDNDNNSTNFAAGAPTPQNTSAFAPLPAKLTHFKASQANNLTTIEFTNETEKDVMSYIVEKAIDGGSFTTLKELQPSKNNGEKVSYKITDQSTVTNTNFYRIKIIESTGKTTYSLIVRLDSKKRAPSLNIAPNPVKGKELNLQVSNLPRGAYFVKIFGMNGQVMSQKNMQFDEGSQTYTLPLNNIKAGMYYIEISGAVKMQKQFVVQ